MPKKRLTRRELTAPIKRLGRELASVGNGPIKKAPRARDEDDAEQEEKDADKDEGDDEDDDQNRRPNRQSQDTDEKERGGIVRKDKSKAPKVATTEEERDEQEGYQEGYQDIAERSREGAEDGTPVESPSSRKKKGIGPYGDASANIGASRKKTRGQVRAGASDNTAKLARGISKLMARPKDLRNK